MELEQRIQKIEERNGENFFVGESKIEGKGCFAARDIAAGEAICDFGGEPASFAEFEQMHEDNPRISCDHLQIGGRTYIELAAPYIYFNHSCEPNAGLKGVQTLTAMRDIAKGEEIAYDYSTTEWTPQDYPPYYTDGWPMVCRCGTASCRGKVGCFPYLSEETKQKYLDSGIIQDYIFERIKEPVESSRCFICEKYL